MPRPTGDEHEVVRPEPAPLPADERLALALDEEEDLVDALVHLLADLPAGRIVMTTTWLRSAVATSRRKSSFARAIPMMSSASTAAATVHASARVPGGTLSAKADEEAVT